MALLQTQCRLCQRVARALHPKFGYRVPKYYDIRSRRFVELGSWKEIQENPNCPTCSLIVRSFNTEFQQYGCDPRLAEYQFGLDDYSGTLLSLVLTSESQTFKPHLPINPLSTDSSERAGILMDQHWVDLERASGWIKSCDTAHGKCHRQLFDPGKPFSSPDMYLVSVSRKCLVKANGGERYVALSYVWGDETQRFKAVKANITFLNKTGSLSTTKIQDQLPNAIQRAMHFTSLLELDFLWVDFLCIVQDDPIHSAAQIDNMANVYSNSYLTLCAADGMDAKSSMRGVPQCLEPRNVQQDVFVFSDGPVTSEWVRQMHGVSIYDERGWTFQEQILSPRTLHFTNHGLTWRCQEAVTQEQHLEIGRPSSTYSDLCLVRADTLWPCLKKWDNLVSAYLKRWLTYDEDILRAFTGILGALDSSMSEGFHFGLPQQFFDAALLWVPVKPLTRREDLRNDLARPAFPSWSWAGWKGDRKNQINEFGLGHTRSDLVCDYRPRLRDVFPCVKWFKINMGTRDKAEIPNNYAKYQSGGLEGTMTLPLGWSSHLDAEGGLYYYMYDKAPSSSTFWYPLPTVRDVQSASGRQWGPILCFKTLRGYLEIGSALPQEKQDGDDDTLPLYSLETEEGEWAGVIYVHQLPEDTSKQEVRCELVLMSGGFAFEDNEEQSEWIPEWNSVRRPRSGDYYLFYHVLWIEWQGDIAYRKGLARVVQKVWDALSKDEVEVLLG